jgi:hypothetical protein
LGALSIIELDTPPDDFLPNEPEGAAFHKAFLASGLTDFTCRYLAIFRHGTRIAVIPYFLSTFKLTDLMTDGLPKKAFAWIKLNYACVGHPSTDFGAIDGEISAEILALVNATLTKIAPLLVYKGFVEQLPLEEFTCARGWPVPVLTVKGDYYSGLDGHRRNDFKHKLEKAKSLRFEEHSGLPDHLLPDVYRLYMNTFEHAPSRFEQLTEAYFRNTASISDYLLFFEANELIGFAQLIGKNQKACFTYVGMDYQRSRQYGLYYVICLRCIEFCVRNGYQQLELGVTSYHFKQLLGGQRIETRLYYRHNNALINWLLGKLKFLIEPSEDELR